MERKHQFKCWQSESGQLDTTLSHRNSRLRLLYNAHVKTITYIVWLLISIMHWISTISSGWDGPFIYLWLFGWNYHIYIVPFEVLNDCVSIQNAACRSAEHNLRADPVTDSKIWFPLSNEAPDNNAREKFYISTNLFSLHPGVASSQSTPYTLQIRCVIKAHNCLESSCIFKTRSLASNSVWMLGLNCDLIISSTKQECGLGSCEDREEPRTKHSPHTEPGIKQ